MATIAATPAEVPHAVENFLQPEARERRRRCRSRSQSTQRIAMKRFITLSALVITGILPLQGCMSSWCAMQGGGSGCSNKPAAFEQTTKENTTASAQVGIVNHTGKFIYSATVDGSGGGTMSRWSAGLANICCATIPDVWRPGIKVLVRWDMPEGHTHIVKEKIVEVEKYDEPGSIYMHFFSNDEVRVVVSNAAGYSKKHPILHTGKPANAASSN
jgi:hypothetical protein